MTQNSYGLYPDDLETNVHYVTTGTLVMDFTGEFDEELKEAVISVLATSVDVHRNDILLSYEDGVVSYQILSDSFDESQDLQSILEKSETVDEVSVKVMTLVSDVTYLNIKSDSLVEVQISVVLDTTMTNNVTVSGNNFKEVVKDTWNIETIKRKPFF